MANVLPKQPHAPAGTPLISDDAEYGSGDFDEADVGLMQEDAEIDTNQETESAYCSAVFCSQVGLSLSLRNNLDMKLEADNMLIESH